MAESTYSLENIPVDPDRFVVLTGCSGGGKSTLLAALAGEGFPTFEEPGRQIVKEQLFIGGSALPWVDPLGFAALAVSRSMHHLALAARSDRRAFFDRGIVDAVSYLEHLDIPVPPPLRKAVTRLRYHETVFVAPPWRQIFAADTERRHSFDVAVAEYRSLVRTYERLGYSPVELPKTDSKGRIRFVLEHLAVRPRS